MQVPFVTRTLLEYFTRMYLLRQLYFYKIVLIFCSSMLIYNSTDIVYFTLPAWVHFCRNSSPPGQNSRHFADDVFKYIFVNEKVCILIKISQNFVSKGSIDNNPALVKTMAWRRMGDKPLSEPMLTRFTDAFMRHKGEMS